jgi:hypothetical protein
LSKNTTREIGLLPPRRAPIAPEQEREATVLLADLFLDAAAKRRGLRSGGALDGVSDGVISSVVPFPEKHAIARDAA